ncbi:MAG: hypothetical protein KUG81_09740 [Gammaproteobacteria bacterium]|nr:hypothetical protein [Gammaproteobacteria bacterium]
MSLATSVGSPKHPPSGPFQCGGPGNLRHAMSFAVLRKSNVDSPSECLHSALCAYLVIDNMDRHNLVLFGTKYTGTIHILRSGVTNSMSTLWRGLYTTNKHDSYTFVVDKITLIISLSIQAIAYLFGSTFQVPGRIRNFSDSIVCVNIDVCDLNSRRVTQHSNINVYNGFPAIFQNFSFFTTPFFLIPSKMSTKESLAAVQATLATVIDELKRTNNMIRRLQHDISRIKHKRDIVFPDTDYQTRPSYGPPYGPTHPISTPINSYGCNSR